MNKKPHCLSSNYSTGYSILLSAFAIILGGIIYILLRPSEFVFFRWFSFLGMDNWIDSARQNSLPFIRLFPEWFIYSLPSGLWAFAYSIIITRIWWRSKSLLKYFWFFSILLLVVGWEILQLTGVVRGTYSFGDIIAGFMGAAMGMYAGIKLTKLKYYERKID